MGTSRSTCGGVGTELATPTRKGLHWSVPPTLHVTPLAARRFALRATGLEVPFARISEALTHLGYVQIDPINICGRMHDLILRNRVCRYREGDLTRHLHRGTNPDSTGGTSSLLPAEQRVAFEHHHPETHILVAFPLDAWPHLLAAMRSRARRTSAWSGRLTPLERALVPRILAEIAEKGPLGSEDFKDERRAHRIVWGASSLVKSTLQKLFFHGRLLIAERTNNRRRYDLPERVLPAAVLSKPQLSEGETSRWLALLKLRQRRLATLKRAEFEVVSDLVQPVAVEGCPTLYCLKEDVPVLERCLQDMTAAGLAPASAASTKTAARVRLLAPLDPLIYDRRVTAALWKFDYTWEAYTPAAKRVRGHYALPVLVGTELVGHVEPKADRAAGKLLVASRSVRRGYRTSEAVADLAGWLGLT